MTKLISLMLFSILAAVALIVDANDYDEHSVQLAELRLTPQLTTDWDFVFQQHQVEGVLVLFDPQQQTLTTNDLSRAHSGYIPASTFKIANGLIGLELAVVAGAEQAYPWDKQPRAFKSWQQDHTFSSAFKYSVVPIFQQIARDIGKQRMTNMLASLEYGNQKLGPELDSFWLDGDIRVSAIEQLQFLQKLHDQSLPVSQRSQEIIKQVMLTESTDNYAIYAKTGFGHHGDKYIGWWVGWLEADERTVYFALNLDLANIQQASLRRKIVKQILQL